MQHVTQEPQDSTVNPLPSGPHGVKVHQSQVTVATSICMKITATLGRRLFQSIDDYIYGTPVLEVHCEIGQSVSLWYERSSTYRYRTFQRKRSMTFYNSIFAYLGSRLIVDLHCGFVVDYS